MSLTAAARGFLFVLLSVRVVQGQDGWGVTYASTTFCAAKRSTVEITCNYTYPNPWKGKVNTVRERFWFINENTGQTAEDGGRVQNLCGINTCTLRIADLSASDSAGYAFRFITDVSGGMYSGVQVQLTVTAVQMNVVSFNLSSNEAELSCQSTCSNSYVWLRNGLKVPEEAPSYTGHFSPGDYISCALKGHEDYGSPSLYAPKVPYVSVSPSGEIMEGGLVNLTCVHDANIEANFTWYKESRALPSKGPKLVFSSINSSDSAEYYCTAENKLGRGTSKSISINVKYPPRLPSVSVSPSAEMEEGSSVTLTCSSDANPAANYIWYKENQTLPLGAEGSYHFPSISSEDRGTYYCKSENQYGEIKSSNIFLDVQYAPKLPSVSVSPSAEIEEGSSVTLTCSSDANPAANYTWYKENQTLPLGREGSYHFTSISSEDRGNYYCESENQYGRIRSRPTCIDVQYAPELPSVSVVIEEGSSVTLTCSSDANPAANYTWYKENEDSPKASGQIFTITDFRAEHSGSYSCEAQNKLGCSNSTLHLTVVGVHSDCPAEWITTAVVSVTALLIIVILTIALLWIGTKRATKPSSETIKTQEICVQKLPAEQKDSILYATVHFSKEREDRLYCNTTTALSEIQKRREETSVEYATVKFNSSSTAPR
ncbi:B-cell receptor CD22-like isoform X2 [Eleginops maclovinus]|uniref:B-cell receptor CD22-like isoform X2 n=1 Tax=Eleginops maclovinus TaxID=56733 RepID=UPI003080D8B4